MKKIIAILVLVLGVLAWRMRAVGDADPVTLVRKDMIHVSLDKKKAELSGVLNGALEEGEASGNIPVPNVESSVLLRWNTKKENGEDDWAWALKIRQSAPPRETLATFMSRIKKELKELPGPLPTPNLQDGWNQLVQDWIAADYLEIPELKEKYARDLALYLVSDASLEKLYSHDETFIDTIPSIIDPKNAHTPAAHMHADIYRYIPYQSGDIDPERKVFIHNAFCIQMLENKVVGIGLMPGNPVTFDQKLFMHLLMWMLKDPAHRQFVVGETTKTTWMGKVFANFPNNTQKWFMKYFQEVLERSE